MRELHVVAVSEDGRHIVLATRKGATPSPEFTVAMDDRLKAAIRGDLPRLGEQQAPQSAVTPKEIQARLRAGESVEQIAASAGVPAARVDRFAGPVLSERERMVAGARAAVLARPRRGLSALPLGDAVAEHLQDMAGHKPDSTTWSARREESGRWLVQVSFVARAKQRTAGWRYDPATKEVVAVDTWSAAIAHADVPASRRATADGTRPRRQLSPSVVPGRSIAAAPPVLVEAAPPPVRRPAAARTASALRAGSRAAAPAPAVRAAAPGKPGVSVRVAARAAAPPARKGASAAPGRRVARAAAPAVAVHPEATLPAPDDTAAAPQVATRARPAAKRTRVTAPTADPAVVDVAEAPPGAAAHHTSPPAEVVAGTATTAPETTAPSPAPAPAAAPQDDRPAGPPTLRVVPSPVPEAPADGAAAAEQEPEPAPSDRQPAREAARPAARRASGGRASVPVWADVLLGTAPVRPAPRDRERD